MSTKQALAAPVHAVVLPRCADCAGPIGVHEGPADGWQLEDGRTVCHACCVKDTKECLDPSSGKTLEVVYTWDDGREEVRYRRPFPSAEAWKFIGQVRTLRERAIRGRYESPYSWRIV